MTLTCPTLSQRHAIAEVRAQAHVSLPLAWRALTLTGVDAQTFLQGQLTCDMKLIHAKQASLGCLLNLKGRIEASLLVLAQEDGYALLMPSNQLAAVKARLAKYAAFSKVSLNEPALAIGGLLNADRLPEDLGAQAYAVAEHAGVRYVRLPGQHRVLTLSVAEPMPAEHSIAQAAWQAEAIASGEVCIDATAVDLWQPQELDYHTLGGVSYQKGCYMGQEIVARLYFRGQLKTGLCWLHADWPESHHAELDWPIMAADKAVGRVIAAAWPDAHAIWLVASVRLDADELYWQRPDGQRLTLTRQAFRR